MSRIARRLDAALGQTRSTGIESARISFVVGIMLIVLTAFMLPPMFTDLAAGHDDWQIFSGSAFVTGFLGLMLILVTRGSWSGAMSIKEGFLLTVVSWLVLPTVAAIPFVFLEGTISLADSWFEAVSGLTTTGSTVIVGLDDMPPGILLWRSILQWIGGIGFVAMALIMLPFLRVGGMQLFQTESSDRSEKFVPRAGELMGLITVAYLALTVACGVAYYAAGMSGFDALNHAMTTMSTGGYSTHDLSLAYYPEPSVHWTATAFMFAGSLPLVLYARCVKTRSLAVWRDEQVVGFAKLTLFVILVLTAWYMANTGEQLLDSLRIVSLNAISVMSTTGYALGDYTLWAAGASGFFFLLMFLNGCTGSTNGGLKMFRVQIMLIITRNYIQRLMSPNRVAVSSYNGKQITSDIATAVLAFVSVMFATLMLLTVALSFYDIDFVTALSSVATAITNVGPGLGPTVGPAGNFATLPEGAKVILAFAMILGRLEYFAVLVVLSREFWR